MKSVESCTDRAFLRVPEYTRFVAGESGEGSGDEQVEKPAFRFEPGRFKDAVVVPFYRSGDAAAQFYCVSSIDEEMSPLSPFPVSSVKV